MKFKKRTFLILLTALITLSSSVQAAYVPLRRTFEDKGYTVTWTAERPDDVLVEKGDHTLEFRNGTNTIEADDGVFHTEQNTYIEDGTTYISEDSIELCDNLYLYHNAIVDAMQADEDEILSLYPIDKSAG